MASTRGLTFSRIERTAHAVGQRVAARLTAETLAASADEQPDRAPCPKCQNSAPVKRKPREILTHEGAGHGLSGSAGEGFRVFAAEG